MGLASSLYGFGAKATVGAYKAIGHTGRAAVVGGAIGAGAGAYYGRPGKRFERAMVGAGIGAVAGGAVGFGLVRPTANYLNFRKAMKGIDSSLAKAKNASLASNSAVNSARDAVSVSRARLVMNRGAQGVKNLGSTVGTGIGMAAQDIAQGARRVSDRVASSSVGRGFKKFAGVGARDIPQGVNDSRGFPGMVRSAAKETTVAPQAKRGIWGDKVSASKKSIWGDKVSPSYSGGIMGDSINPSSEGIMGDSYRGSF